LNVRAYWVGSWKPKLDAKPVTEEVARAAYDLGKNLPDNAAGGIEVDTVTGAVSTSGAEACIAPGSPEEDAECDWSAGESDVEVVQAVPASRPFPKSEMKVEGEENALRSDGVETKEEDLPAENSTGGSADAPMWAAGGLEQSKEVEPLVPKAEEIVEGNQPPVRRRRIKFGSAHLHLLKAVADADAHNWASLQSAIGSATSSSQVKSELVERLEHLADLRVQSMVAAEKRAQEHAQRAKHYTEAETQYQRGLNDEMLRLERMNPVGPRSSVPLISDARLRQDIEAGRPIWQARREHRARQRAARFRQENAERPALDPSQPSQLTEVPPAEGGTVLDQAFAASARANLQEFKGF
jgi:hypothetical protein